MAGRPSKHDWRALYEEFIKAHLDTGITQGEWCANKGVDVTGFSRNTKPFRQKLVSKPSVGVVKALVQQEVKAIVKDNIAIAKGKLLEALPIAADKLVQLSQVAEKDTTMLAASESILDRCGLAQEKQSVNVNTQVIFPALIAGIDANEVKKMLGAK